MEWKDKIFVVTTFSMQTNIETTRHDSIKPQPQKYIFMKKVKAKSRMNIKEQQLKYKLKEGLLTVFNAVC